ncbi:MAG: tetratricopeptide repeat protein [Deltaproteobacteria bacterium]|nr:tetratricopeptide repeat protein [Deltaproteobacteria bacterium]
MAHTQRIRRKELRQPDEFVTLSRRVVAYFEENRTIFFMAVGGTIVLLAAILIFRAVRTSRETGAAQAYAQAHTLLDDKKYLEAATAFQQVADSYSSTSFAILAQLENANVLLMAGKAGEAALAYQKFLDAGPPTDYLRQAALVRLGHAQEQSDKPADAARAYASAAELPGPYAEEALAGQARTAETTGDAATAKDLYTRFLAKYPESDRRALAMSRLVALGGTPPAERAAPSATVE